MKTLITPNLLKFTLTTLALTIVFRWGLSTSINHEMIVPVILCAMAYALSMWFTGAYFGQKEYEFLPIYDIGFRFHLATFLAHNLISIVWFVLGLESKYEHINTIYITAMIWLVFLITHFIYFLSMKKKSIKNLDKEDLFE